MGGNAPESDCARGYFGGKIVILGGFAPEISTVSKPPKLGGHAPEHPVSGATSKSVSCGHPLPAWLFVAENRCPQPDTRCLRCRPGWCWMPAARGAVRGGFCRIPAVTAVLNGRPEDADLLVARDTVTHVKVSRAIAFPAAWCPVEDTDLPSRHVRH